MCRTEANRLPWLAGQLETWYRYTIGLVGLGLSTAYGNTSTARSSEWNWAGTWRLLSRLVLMSCLWSRAVVPSTLYLGSFTADGGKLVTSPEYLTLPGSLSWMEDPFLSDFLSGSLTTFNHFAVRAWNLAIKG